MFRRIKDLREDNDLKQWQLAEYLHCSQRSYSNYERGVANIPPKYIGMLADFYHTSTDYLLGLTDVYKPYPPKQD